MANLVYDDVMLREPRLLVPGRAPVGPCRVSDSRFTYCLLGNSDKPIKGGGVFSAVAGVAGTFYLDGNSCHGIISVSYANLGTCAEAGLPTGSSVTLVVANGYTQTPGTNGFMGNGATDGTAILIYLPFSSNTTVYFRWGGNSSAQEVTVNASPYAVTDHWVFSAGPAGMTICGRGRLLASNSNAPSRTQTTNPLRFGTCVNANPDLARASMIAWAPVQLPLAEQAALSRDPFAILSPA